MYCLQLTCIRTVEFISIVKLFYFVKAGVAGVGIYYYTFVDFLHKTCKPLILEIMKQRLSHLWTLFVLLHVLCLSSSVCGTEPPEVRTGKDLNTDSDDLTVEVENEESEALAQNVFEPTSEWKTVEDGQAIPPGLHVRMNLQTGLKEAKILDESEEADISQAQNEDESQFEKSGTKAHKESDLQQTQESTDESGTTNDPDDGRASYHGKSDRRGIINKKTKPFTKAELAEMLKRLNDDSSVDFSKLPGITSSTPVEESQADKDVDTEQRKLAEEPKITFHDSKHELPLTFHRDVEIMLEHTKTLADEAVAVPQLLFALEELEFYVHQIDNARDLNVIGGLVLVVRLLNHSEPEVRSHAAHVLGSASQSNPHVQGDVLQYGGLELLCKLLAVLEQEVVQRRALFAISALLRGNPNPQQVFLKQCQGFQLLGQTFHDRSPELQLKAVTLLTDILNEVNDEPHSTLVQSIEENNWCSHVASLITFDAVGTVEKGLLAMKALTSNCDFTPLLARLQELASRFQKDLANEREEFTLSLLELCRYLVNSVRQRNREL